MKNWLILRIYFFLYWLDRLFGCRVKPLCWMAQRIYGANYRMISDYIIGDDEDDQAWFWTPEFQALEHEATREIASGQYSDFATMEEFLADLDSDDK